MTTTPSTGKTLGILGLQGDFDAHRKMLSERLGASTRIVRTPAELDEVDALILPGGESTTIGKLLERIGLWTPIRERVAGGMPIYGTCAGMILLARAIEGRPDQPTLGLMNITVARNAFGRQLDSFEAEIPFLADDDAPDQTVHGVFIRAPYVTEAADDVRVLGQYQGRIIAVRQGHLLATAFHPELTDNPRVHAYFLKMLADS